METLKVEIVSRYLVKPSSPTPAHLRDHKLCFLDQFVPEHHAAIIFFYSFNSDIVQSNSENDNDENYYCRILKKSLADTLTDFYPIAGQLKDSSTIECNDKGGYVVEAKINSTLSDFLTSVSHTSDEKLEKLVPSLDSETMELASKCMLIPQITIFECRGVSITLCLQHRLCDLNSALVFLKNWSARARGASDHEIALPDFVGHSFLPPRDLPAPPAAFPNSVKNLAKARLVFEASKIESLKTRFAASTAPQSLSISRVEAVLALILKCAITAARSLSTSPETKPSLLSQAVNLRKRTVPPLPDNSIGNLIWAISVRIDDVEVQFHDLVRKIRRETTSFCDETVRRIKGGGYDEATYSMLFEMIQEKRHLVERIGGADAYWCTSWCGFPVYEMDFGWGKPAWVCSGILVLSNVIVLEDTKCGRGIQAWVTLDPKVMAIFQHDEELLSFASLNPSILT